MDVFLPFSVKLLANGAKLCCAHSIAMQDAQNSSGLSVNSKIALERVYVQLLANNIGRAVKRSYSIQVNSK